MDWSDERIAELKKLWLEGFSASQVARRLGGGVTRNAVIGKVHRMGLSGRDVPSRPRSLGGRPPSLGKGRASAGGQLRAPTARPPRPFEPTLVLPEMKPSATILTLSEHTCRWPIGDPDQVDFGFCGRLKASQGPYCKDHSGVAARRRPTQGDAAEIDFLVRRFAGGVVAAPARVAAR